MLSIYTPGHGGIIFDSKKNQASREPLLRLQNICEDKLLQDDFCKVSGTMKEREGLRVRC